MWCLLQEAAQAAADEAQVVPRALPADAAAQAKVVVHLLHRDTHTHRLGQYYWETPKLLRKKMLSWDRIQ